MLHQLAPIVSQGETGSMALSYKRLLMLHQLAPIVRDLHYSQSGGKPADEQEPPAQKLERDPRENGNDRVEKHEKATESHEDSGPDGNCPRSPKRNPNQCRAEDGADNKHRVV